MGFDGCYSYVISITEFISFYAEIMDAQRFMFYIILSNYVRSILFCWDKHRDISQTWFHIFTKVHCCKKHVCERRTLSGQPNMPMLMYLWEIWRCTNVQRKVFVIKFGRWKQSLIRFHLFFIVFIKYEIEK